MATILTGVIVIMAVAGGYMYIKNMKVRKNLPEKDIATPQDSPSPDKEYRAVLDSLLNLNILLRKDPDFPDEMTLEIEAIIDDLMAITPSMMEKYPNETLTYEIKKIGSLHLYKTIKEFLDLSLDSRNNQFNIFKKTIESLHEVSRRSRDIVEKNETAEFKTMANFLAGKFS